MVKEMDKANIVALMVKSMLVILKMEYSKVKEHSFIMMGVNMWVNGRMAKEMEMVNIFSLMAINMWVNLKIVNTMEMVHLLHLMVVVM